MLFYQHYSIGAVSQTRSRNTKKQSELDWFNCSFDKDSVYGAEVNKAYEYLKANKKKAKKDRLLH